MIKGNLHRDCIQEMKTATFIHDGRSRRNSLSSCLSSLRRLSFDSALTLFGMFMMCAGSVGFFRLLSSPLNPLGASAYTIAGFVLAMSYSDTLRIYFVNSIFSKAALELLYEKSILQIMMEPSPYAKALTLVALSWSFEQEEITQLVHALPPSCDILRSHGLIHVLPRAVTATLYFCNIYLGTHTLNRRIEYVYILFR